MPRYFFSLASSEGTLADDEGEELPNDASAHEAALQTAKELRGWDRVTNASVIVKDDDGRFVTEVPLTVQLN